MIVSVTSRETPAQSADYNVFYLVSGTEYTVRLQNISNGTYDDSGDWSVSVDRVVPTALNAGIAAEGEWFSFTPDADGNYTVTGTPAPLFAEVMTAGSASGDWDTYALDKEVCRLGMTLDHLRSLKAEIKTRQEALSQSDDTYNKALQKLDSYQKLYDTAESAGLMNGDAGLFNSKQRIYDGLKQALLRGDSTLTIPFLANLDLPAIDKDTVEALPDNVKDLPAYLSNEMETNEKIRDAYNEQKAELEADEAAYEAEAAQLPNAEALVNNTSVETASLRDKVQSDADAIMGSGTALAADGANGMKLVAAQWLNDENGAMTVPLTAGTAYTIHALSNMPLSVTVTQSGEQPPTPDVDKSALEKAVNSAKAIDTDKYTEDSVAALNDALAAAEAVLEDEDADQATVNNAAETLADAVNNLERKPSEEVDKTALNEAIAKAEAIDRDKYTDESLSALDTALAAAKRLSDSSLATQRLVDLAANALNTAIDGLEEKPSDDVDKSALINAISTAVNVEREAYTDESLAAMDKALDDARAVRDDAAATQEDVDAAANALSDAIAALEEKPVTPPAPEVDKTALEQAIRDAEAVDTAKYTETSVAAMTEALRDAKAVRDDAAATQEDVDAAANALSDAVKALQEKPVSGVDKSALQEAIDKAEAIDRDKYTDESLAALNRQLASAKTTLANDNASQSAVNLAARRLNNALSNLVEKDVAPVTGVCDGGASCPSKKFTDVDQTKWYHEAVDYAIVNNLFNGTSGTTFEPNTAMTRGMLVTVLYRMEGSPAAFGATMFTDLRQSWYRNAVAWAAENKIVNGIDATHFAPDAKVTRQQAMTMLMRYADYKGYDTSARTDLSAFRDAGSISAYALDAMQWAVSVGLIQGMTATTLVPRGESTRAQIATILMRFQENVAK